MLTDCQSQLAFWNMGRQQVTVDFAGGKIVSDAGLLTVRDFEKRLGIIAGLAARVPDPRSPCSSHIRSPRSSRSMSISSAPATSTAMTPRRCGTIRYS